jgi:carbon-monoxide dehydrogenase medium subunit
MLAAQGPAARMLAGGTDILVQLRAGLYAIDTLVDVKHIPALNQLHYDPQDGLTVGAAVPCLRLYTDPTVVRLYPALVDSGMLIGSVQIQGRASVGGNLCNAAPSGDTIPTLIALGATCVVAGPQGQRRVPAEAFCLGPRRTVLAPGELLVALQVPVPQPRAGARYLRFIPRNEMDIAVAGVGAWVQLAEDGRHIRTARIALASVGPTPIYAAEASALLAGTEAGEASYKEAGAAAAAAARPITDIRGTVALRKQLVNVLTVRALRTAVARAEEAA